MAASDSGSSETHNPFSPSFGISPPLLAGRSDVLDGIGEALDTGPTHPDYSALLIGVRGAGKTVMLNAVEELARDRNWETLSVSASPAGLPGRLIRRASELLDVIKPTKSKRQVSSVTAAGFGVGFEADTRSEQDHDLRGVLSILGDLLTQNGTGLLITIDELQSGKPDELREFGTVLQHVSRRERRAIAFVGAGLPAIEDTLLSDEAATFLQRCARYEISQLDMRATRRALVEPIHRHGRSIDAEALDQAVRATSGYAFMIQLVGFHSWQAAESASYITTEHVASGIAKAQQRIGPMVLAPVWKALSDGDRRFLRAMVQDEGESRLADIAARLDVTTSYVSVYRDRLLRVGMIVSTRWGHVTLAHHAARDWIRDQFHDHPSSWGQGQIGTSL